MNTNHPTYIKIDNTFSRVMDEINKFEKVFKQGGRLEQAILEIDGDPSYLKALAQSLSNAYEALEEAHFGVIGHVVDDSGRSESVQENKKTSKEGVLDSDDEDGFMARSQLYFLARDAIKLHSVIQDQDDLEPWVQNKIASSSKDMDAVRRYTEYNAMKAEVEPEGMELNTHSHDEGIPEPQPEMSIEPDMEETVIEIPEDMVEEDLARDYVKAHARERMIDMHPISKNAFLASLEDTYPGIRSEIGETQTGLPTKEEEEKAVAVAEGMEFDDNNAHDDLQVIAKDMFKNALSNAKKTHKEAKVAEGIAISGATPNTGNPHKDNTVITVKGGTGSTLTGATPTPKPKPTKPVTKAMKKAPKAPKAPKVKLQKGGGLKQGSKAGRATAVTMQEVEQSIDEKGPGFNKQPKDVIGKKMDKDNRSPQADEPWHNRGAFKKNPSNRRKTKWDDPEAFKKKYYTKKVDPDWDVSPGHPSGKGKPTKDEIDKAEQSAWKKNPDEKPWNRVDVRF